MNDQNSRKAINTLHDYLYALGGAAIPVGRGMKDTELILYVLTKIYELHDKEFDASYYFGYDFISIANHVIDKTDDIISEISLSDRELIPFIKKHYEYYDSKFDDLNKSSEWIQFGKTLTTRRN